jgi:hypothetical protein
LLDSVGNVAEWLRAMAGEVGSALSRDPLSLFSVLGAFVFGSSVLHAVSKEAGNGVLQLYCHVGLVVRQDLLVKAISVDDFSQAVPRDGLDFRGHALARTAADAAKLLGLPTFPASHASYASHITRLGAQSQGQGSREKSAKAVVERPFNDLLNIIKFSPSFTTFL